VAAAFIASPAPAGEFDWHSRANQAKMDLLFRNAAKTCAGAFGFTHISELSESAMSDKIDAYLLLRDSPDSDLADWLQILQPIDVILDRKSSDATEADDRRAAAAAVAAAEDPVVYDQAERRYLEGAMAPINRALEACRAGANDPFLGKYYWTGTGSADSFEKSFEDWFATFVAELRRKKPVPRRR
jgi:hypothetical protein